MGVSVLNRNSKHHLSCEGAKEKKENIRILSRKGMESKFERTCQSNVSVFN